MKDRVLILTLNGKRGGKSPGRVAVRASDIACIYEKEDYTVVFLSHEAAFPGEIGDELRSLSVVEPFKALCEVWSEIF